GGPPVEAACGRIAVLLSPPAPSGARWSEAPERSIRPSAAYRPVGPGHLPERRGRRPTASPRVRGSFRGLFQLLQLRVRDFGGERQVFAVAHHGVLALAERVVKGHLIGDLGVVAHRRHVRNPGKHHSERSFAAGHKVGRKHRARVEFLKPSTSRSTLPLSSLPAMRRPPATLYSGL